MEIQLRKENVLTTCAQRGRTIFNRHLIHKLGCQTIGPLLCVGVVDRTDQGELDSAMVIVSLSAGGLGISLLGLGVAKLDARQSLSHSEDADATEAQVKILKVTVRMGFKLQDLSTGTGCMNQSMEMKALI